MNRHVTGRPIDVLLVEDEESHVRHFKQRLAKAGPKQFDLTCVGHLEGTIKCLGSSQYDIVMLDHTLPDSTGFDTFISVRMHAPTTPIILLSSASDEDLAVRALQSGAQDCIIKGKMDSGELSRSIRYAIERHRIMAELEQARQREYRMAYYDGLTQLPNRQLFIDRLGQSLSHAQRYEQKVALMFIDLDGFKEVNDTYGHECGDGLLKAVAERLKVCLRKSDTVARMGGDEFTCILSNIRNDKDISIVAHKIIDSLSKRFDIGADKIYISGSIGASIYPDDAEDIQTLVKNSDMAMYHAKKQGKNNFQFFSDDGGSVVSIPVTAQRTIQGKTKQKPVSPRRRVRQVQPTT